MVLLFQDEGRFGLINRNRRCWSFKGNRPLTPKKIVKKYTYGYTATEPKTGKHVSLILPYSNTYCMNIFIKELKRNYKGKYIVMVVDGVAYHGSRGLKLGNNIKLIKQPPYSPELNPVENFWKYVRDNYFGNELFKDMKGVEDRLEYAYVDLGKKMSVVKSVSEYNWIKDLL